MIGDTLTYHGTIRIGKSATSESNLNVVYDTGSDWLVVEGKDCLRAEKLPNAADQTRDVKKPIQK